MSFTSEQLGVPRGELPQQVMQPPSAYPPLDLNICKFESSNELDYLVELRRDFAEYMRDSVNHVLLEVQKKDIERYSDRYQAIVDSSVHQSKLDWSRMPAELKSKSGRPKRKIPIQKSSAKEDKETTEIPIGRKRKRKRARVIDDDDEDDEQQKSTKQTTTSQPEKQIKQEVEEDEEKDSDEEMDDDYEEVMDEEMDDGTDYVNNYFDNGEAFDDEDDNLDDGPVY